MEGGARVLAVGDTGRLVMAAANSEASLGQADTIIKEADPVQEKVMQTQRSVAGGP